MAQAHLKTSVLLFCGIFSISAGASDLDFAPHSFSKNGKNHVFMDFETADYQITYDVAHRETKTKSTIRFTIRETGFPIFDLVEPSASAKLDGENVSVRNIDFPEGGSKARYLDRSLSPGEHVVVIESFLKDSVTYDSNSVKSAFFMSDLSDREFLEKYLPANLDFDQVQMTFDVQLLGRNIAPHTLQINCPQTRLTSSHFRAECPATYNNSSVLYHIYKSDRFITYRSKLSSISGDSVDLTIYGTSPAEYAQQAAMYFAELEADYGPWPHKQLLIYATEYGGGMEYAGATMTSLWALGHEMHHSYFARSTFPMGGNAGWMDEAMASWRDDGYPSIENLTAKDRTHMAGYSEYYRVTDTDAYSSGSRFVAHLDFVYKDQGGFKAFMKHYHARNVGTGATTDNFEKAIASFYGRSASSLFSRYVYGKEAENDGSNVFKTRQQSPRKQTNRFHKKLSEIDTQSLL